MIKRQKIQTDPSKLPGKMIISIRNAQDEKEKGSGVKNKISGKGVK